MEHFIQLSGNTDQRALDNITKRPELSTLDKAPDFSELLNAIAIMKKNKAPGRCENPVEI